MKWDEWFMGFALQASKKSKDPTQVGAALVGADNALLLCAFNGPPRGVLDLPERFVRPEKYLFASHAEQNLVAFAARHGIRTEGCHVYVTHCPCASCARTLIQAGVQTVTYGAGETSMAPAEFDAARSMFKEARVHVRTAI